jgi:hypothetical protein
MSENKDIIEMFKELQDNYIKSIERENEELRKQRERDSLKIEALEKRIQELEINIDLEKSMRNNHPTIGTGNGFDWTTPRTTPIWTYGGTTTGGTMTGASGSIGIGGVGETAYNGTETFKSLDNLRVQYVKMRDALQNNDQSIINECKKVIEYNKYVNELTMEQKDDN